jgi:hypothetical protein
MNILNTTLAVLALLGPSLAQAEAPQAESPLANATETVAELRDLYDEADDTCRVPGSQEAKTVVACMSRAIYGQTLNEKGWCWGKDDQPNAEMQWHECTPTSLRYTPLDLPGL